MKAEKLTLRDRPKESERTGRPFTMTGGTAKERKQATDVLHRIRTRAVRERPESPEDVETERMLHLINGIIDTEFRRIGLIDTEGRTTYKPLSIEEVHGVRYVVNGDAGSMVYDDKADIIQYELGQDTVSKFVGLLHEAIHTTESIEFSPMWMSYGAAEPEPVILRSGYMTGEAYKGGSPSYWKWLNEAVVHSRALRLVQRNVGELVKKFPHTTADMWLNQDKDMYGGSRRLADIIEERLAGHFGAGIEEMRDEFFRRHVTGDMSHLDKIDQIYGTGTKDTLEHVHYRSLDKRFDSEIAKIFAGKIS